LISNLDLLWICSTPELQLKALHKLQSFSEIKTIIEKPITEDQLINKEISNILTKQGNIFISRPWTFSKLWQEYKHNLTSDKQIRSIKVRHSGELLREYINPPQDWLHHDLCLLHEINLDVDLTKVEGRKIWSNNNKNLSIQSNNGVNIDVVGGYSLERNSILETISENNTTLTMDMNQKSLTVRRGDSAPEVFKYSDDLPINSMVEHFVGTKIDKSNQKRELVILKALQILSM
jgi:hypothetical protein